MSVTVGVREFRRDLAEYIDGDELVTVTRHGRRVGVFVPARDDRAEAIAAYQLGAESGLLTSGVLPLAQQFQGHHK